MLSVRRLGLRYSARLLRRELAAHAGPGGGIGLKTAVAGMVGTAGLGIGIGLLLPSFVVGDGDKSESKDSQPQGRPHDRRKSTVYESASVIAEEIERPAMVQDATRAEVETLYEFKSCLASGGTGSVWRAVDRRTGEAVAIKVIDKKKLNPALFNMEVFAMQRCSGHPHIVQLLAAFDVPPSVAQPNGEWHVVMELAEGGELFERLLRHGAYTELVASEIARQIASAVYHMHSCGVVHRDLKPENLVLMTESDAPHVKLIDFGTAIILEENEQARLTATILATTTLTMTTLTMTTLTMTTLTMTTLTTTTLTITTLTITIMSRSSLTVR